MPLDPLRTAMNTDPMHDDTATPPPLLQVQGLRSRHGGPYDLAIGAAECVAVVGPSGSGKSVLLRLIADLDPHEGDVVLEGRSRTSWAPPQWRRQVVYQSAEPAWWADTASAHMNPNRLDDVAPMLAQLGLDNALLTADIARLSTGERQRMALVRSLSFQPRVLLLDEPTAALDTASALAVEQLLRERMRSQGLAVAIVTHSPEQATRLAHRVFDVRNGQVHAR